jgi:hypothetical protein
MAGTVKIMPGVDLTIPTSEWAAEKDAQPAGKQNVQKPR